MEKDNLNSMFENLVHIGNKTNFWNPKMKPYIYGSVNGIHVINLVKTDEKLEEVKAELKELHTAGKKILFVGTKLQARDAVEKIAKDSWHYYVIEKWVPGLLTNWKTIKRRISTYIQLSKDLENGVFDILTKKEKASKILELDKLDRAYRWVKEMKKIPDVVFVVDGIYEDQALKEANSLNLVSFAVLNTNGDDTVVDNCIPANTNSVKSIDYVIWALKDSVSGKVVWEQKKEGLSKFKKLEDKKEIETDDDAKTSKEETPEVKEEVVEEVVVVETEAPKAEAKATPKVEKKAPAKKAPVKATATKKPAAKKAPAKKEA